MNEIKIDGFTYRTPLVKATTSGIIKVIVPVAHIEVVEDTKKVHFFNVRVLDSEIPKARYIEPGKGIKVVGKIAVSTFIAKDNKRYDNIYIIARELETYDVPDVTLIQSQIFKGGVADE